MIIDISLQSLISEAKNILHILIAHSSRIIPYIKLNISKVTNYINQY